MPTPAEKAEIIAKALATLAVVETSPKAVSDATGIPAREVGMTFTRNRAELDAACAAVGVQIVAYYHRRERNGARIEFSRNV